MKNLTDLQRKTLDFVVKSGLIEDFYLAGGTAIIMKYAHRHSEDFDFFTFEISHSFWKRLEEVSRKATEEGWTLVYEKIDWKSTAIFKLDGVRFSFFSYPYKLVKPLDKRFYPLLLASDEDIIAMKSIAIIQRGSKKDFFDFYFLLKKNNWSLGDVISICQKKYGGVFLPFSLLKALTYFEEAERERFYPEIEEKWEEVKKYLEELVKNYFFEESRKLKRKHRLKEENRDEDIDHKRF